MGGGFLEFAVVVSTSELLVHKALEQKSAVFLNNSIYFFLFGRNSGLLELNRKRLWLEVSKRGGDVER